MSAPWAETAAKVVIEFKKESEGCKRKVHLSHTRQQGVPNQLANRVDPKVYDALLAECERLAEDHPYIAAANLNCCCANFMALFTFCVVGFGCFQGDAGDYDVWIQKVQQSLNAQSPAFQQSGCKLSVQSVHGCFWVQIDITQPPIMQPQPIYQQQPYQQQPYQQQPYQQQPYQQQAPQPPYGKTA